MRSPRWRVLLSLFALLAGLGPGLTRPAAAGPPTNHLRSGIEEVVRVLDDPQFRMEDRARERRAAVRRIAEDIFDFAETAKRALGRHWPVRTPAEREEFVQLFTDLLERAYLSKIDLYSGESITYVSESIDGDTATVRTRITTRQGAEVPVDYRMLRKGDRWLVYDVSIEGVSLVANYRTQFNKIIQASSYQELVKKMKSKQEEFLDQEKRRT
jgi:phospholipid transport system substrate-binding protein